MDLKESIRNQTDVALEITKKLLQTEGKDKNMVHSPISIHIALSLIAAGTKGPTLDQFLSFLKSKSIYHLNSLAFDLVTCVLATESPNVGPRLSFTNGLWVDKSLPFKPQFKQVVGNAYKAALKQVDFEGNPDEARVEVNSWVDKETDGLIKEILPRGSIHKDMKLIFANALYFKASWDWDEHFNASDTKQHDFYLLNGNSVRAVPYMTTSGLRFITAFDGFKVLKLPYRSRGSFQKRCFSMYIFLPDARDGLPALVERVCSESGFLDQHLLPCERVLVGDLLIPKFKISSGFDASQVLKSLGLVLPFVFDILNGGNVTEMVKSPACEDPYVEAIFHKCVIEVNEEGTLAAAATGASLSGGFCPEKKEDFVADHPFMFLIREDMTGTVLFIGHVLNPLAG